MKKESATLVSESSDIIEVLRRIETKIDLLTEVITMQRIKDKLLGEWRSEQDIQKLLRVSRNSLLKLRKEGMITRSSISGKKNYYRLSDFKKLLDTNEEKE